MKLTLIVTTYNWPESLLLVMESIKKQTILPDELIIADDGSGEKTRDLINPLILLNFGAVPYREDQVMHLEANIDLLTNATGWRPIVDINEGLLETVNWWRSVQ